MSHTSGTVKKKSYVSTFIKRKANNKNFVHQIYVY